MRHLSQSGSTSGLRRENFSQSVFHFCQTEMIGIDSKNPSVNTLVHVRIFYRIYINKIWLTLL